MSLFKKRPPAVQHPAEPVTPLDVLAPATEGEVISLEPRSPVHVPQGYEIKIAPHTGVYSYTWAVLRNGRQLISQWCDTEAEGLAEAQIYIKDHQKTQEHLKQPTKRFVADRIIEE